ncbi:histidine kinase [Leptospira gomenensis]|uniref:histidine kinase n=1 Tax=Leptospira gomenensis TaxID=2484974 RepID=A0A5F1YA88_9LEPT|nr:7TM diverse intracellular signaling domain-containing protein [Leptospira gomenensis]TGK31819.1 histidine kinase [Leptospira gomenensis]TGK41554.1 histidine kinase [Leptospira gomenensis]TGK61488.1 histidine kinase [Leptospira gomenensis]
MFPGRLSIVYFFIIFIFYCFPSVPAEKTARAERGIIDLRKTDLNKTTAALDGEWEFHWKELARGTSAISGPVSYRNVPGIWRDYDPAYPLRGYATYRLRVLCDRNRPNLKIAIPRLPGVYQVYFDDHKVYSNGFTGVDASETVFIAHPLVKNEIVPSENFLITVVVSNFKGNHLKGGIRNSFLIGDGQNLDLKEKRDEWAEIILVSVIFSFGIYHIVFFFSYRKDIAPLYFAVFCFLVSLYSFITSGIQYMAFPGLSLDLRIRIEFFCEVAFFPSVYLMLTKMFPVQFRKKWMYYSVGSAVVFFSGIVLLNEVDVVRLYSVYMHFPPLYAIVLIRGTTDAFRAKEPQAKTILITGVVLALTMMNDVVYGLYEVYFLFPYSFPLGLVAFVALNSYIVSSRFTDDLEKAKEFAQLQLKYNEQLELSAAERNRIASDIHDSIGSELTAILFELESKDKSDPTLRKLKSEVNHLVSNVRDIVFLMRHSGNNRELVEDVMRRYEDRLRGTGTFEIDSDIRDVSNLLRLDQCLHVQKIFLEVMTNILRHAEAKKIRIVWTIDEPQTLKLKVIDDGKPFSADSSEKRGIGLDNIAMRAEKLSAIYGFRRIGTENVFEIKIPIQ